MKLIDKAKEFGVSVLPGQGSLTLATRHMTGGRKAVLAYIQLAASEGDVDCQTWWHVWSDLSKYEQQTITFDDVCAASGVSAVKLLKTIVGVAFEANCDVASLVAATAHPEVVKRSVRFAKEQEGIEDRKLLFQHHGFTPTPKGTSITIGVSANAQAASAASADQSVPSFLDDVDTTGSITGEIQKLIEGGTVEVPWSEKNKDGVLITKDQEGDS